MFVSLTRPPATIELYNVDATRYIGPSSRFASFAPRASVRKAGAPSYSSSLSLSLGWPSVYRGTGVVPRLRSPPPGSPARPTFPT